MLATDLLLLCALGSEYTGRGINKGNGGTSVDELSLKNYVGITNWVRLLPFEAV